MAGKGRPGGTGENGPGSERKAVVRDDDLERRRRQLEASLAQQIEGGWFQLVADEYAWHGAYYRSRQGIAAAPTYSVKSRLRQSHIVRPFRRAAMAKRLFHLPVRNEEHPRHAEDIAAGRAHAMTRPQRPPAGQPNRRASDLPQTAAAQPEGAVEHAFLIVHARHIGHRPWWAR